MKKQFQLSSPNKKMDRQIEAIKFEIKKYIARERRKKLPEGSTSWEFECRIGESTDNAAIIKISDINPMIDQMVVEEKDFFYLEILVTAVSKPNHLK